MRKIALFMMVAMMATTSIAQVDARLFRYPDVSGSHISFVYGGDIWLFQVRGSGNRVTSSTGEESFQVLSRW
jgi:tricorn protease